MLSLWWVLLTILGFAVLFLAVYAGRLLWLLRQQKIQQQQQQAVFQQQQADRVRYLTDSIILISKAMLEEQCELSEGALRIWRLLEQFPSPLSVNPETEYPGIYQMFELIKDMPTHKARQQQDKKLIRQQDKIRQQAELDLKLQIAADCRQLLKYFS